MKHLIKLLESDIDYSAYLCLAIGNFTALGSTLFGEFTVSIKALLLFMLFNIASGIIRAFHQKSERSKSGGVSSNAFLRGLTSKVMVLILLSAAHWCDILLGINYIMNAAGYAFIAHELLSIIENYTLLAGNPPKIFEKVLDMIEEKEREPWHGEWEGVAPDEEVKNEKGIDLDD